MKHFSIWQWTDYVRVLGDDVTRSAMDAHLTSGCARCQRTVNVLRGVASTARDEADYEPPEHAIRYAQAIYSLSRPEKASLPRLIARLVHDSIRDPLPAGMRSQDRPSRHALYEAGSYCLDLQLEQQLASGLVMLIGQLADRKKPATSTADVPIWLMDRKSLVASTLCNPFGEFQLEYAPARDLRLHVPLRAAGKRLEVPLDRLTPGLPGKPRPAKIARRQTRREPGGR
jgi:anti-sigma factor RsiW